MVSARSASVSDIRSRALAPQGDDRHGRRPARHSAAFNRWAGIEVADADTSTVELRLPWREEFGRYAGFLHAISCTLG